MGICQIPRKQPPPGLYPSKRFGGGRYDKLSNNNLPNGCVLSNPKQIIKILLIGSIVPLATSLLSLIRFMLSFLLLWNCLQIYFQTMLWWMPETLGGYNELRPSTYMFYLLPFIRATVSIINVVKLCQCYESP